MKTVSLVKNAQIQEVVVPKIFCVGRNYYDHIQELNNEIPEEMVIFFKPNVCINKGFNLHFEHTEFEGEICFLIKNSQIIAVGIGLDLTLRNKQKELKQKGLPWERAKAFKDSAVFGEFVEFGNIEDLSLKLFINNNLTQNCEYSKMIYKPSYVLENLQKTFDLEDYDVIMSGTPKGVGELKKGDKFDMILQEKDKILSQKSWII